MNVDKGTCRGCGAAIMWIVNENGKKEPFDAKATRMLRLAGDGDPDKTIVAFVEPEVKFKVVAGHINHFVTCPQHDQFRGKARPNA